MALASGRPHIPRMPRVTVGRSLEIQFQSPSDLVGTLAPVVEQGAALRLPLAQGALPPGAEHPVSIHIPWIGRRLELLGRVLGRLDGDTAAPAELRILDGPRDTLADLGAIVGRLRSGAILHDTTNELPAEQRIRAMSPQLRAMLAAHANAEERLVLARESDPRVIDFLLKNPSLTIDEVRRIGSKLVLNQGHFAVMSRNPAWMADETLRAILSKNPRLPEFLAETILQTLSTPALKAIVESANATASTRRVAGRILQSRGVVVSARRGTV